MNHHVTIENTPPVKNEPLCSGTKEETLETVYREPVDELPSQKPCLTDLARDMVFFHHGALFSHGWSIDPLADHPPIRDGICKPLVVGLPEVGFFGLPEPWNRQVLAVPKEDWDGVFRFLGSIAARDASRGLFHICIFQKLMLWDYLWLAGHIAYGQPPAVECYCLAVMGNHYSAYFWPSTRAAVPLCLIRGQPSAGVQRMAASLPGDMGWLTDQGPLVGGLPADWARQISEDKPTS
jgi:hypothetical protein